MHVSVVSVYPAVLPVTEKRWLTLDETAKRLGIAHSTLREWDDRGVFEKTWRTDGGHRRFDPAEIDRFVAANKQAASGRLSELRLVELAVRAVRDAGEQPGQALELAEDLDALADRLRRLADDLRREAGQSGR